MLDNLFSTSINKPNEKYSHYMIVGDGWFEMIFLNFLFLFLVKYFIDSLFFLLSFTVYIKWFKCLHSQQEKSVWLSFSQLKICDDEGTLLIQNIINERVGARFKPLPVTVWIGYAGSIVIFGPIQHLYVPTIYGWHHHWLVWMKTKTQGLCWCGSTEMGPWMSEHRPSSLFPMEGRRGEGRDRQRIWGQEQRGSKGRRSVSVRER